MHCYILYLFAAMWPYDPIFHYTVNLVAPVEPPQKGILICYFLKSWNSYCFLVKIHILTFSRSILKILKSMVLLHIITLVISNFLLPFPSFGQKKLNLLGHYFSGHFQNLMSLLYSFSEQCVKLTEQNNEWFGWKGE